MRDDHDTMQPPAPPKPTASLAARMGLWVQSTPDVRLAGTVVDLGGGGAQTLGRGEGTTVRFDDGWQSRVHARVTLAPGGRIGQGPWRVEDLGTRNGTFINGERVDNGELHPGDVLRVGATVLLLGEGVVELDDLGLVGRSVGLASVRTAIRAVAQGTRPVHVTGESGAGKEVVASALHRASGRKGTLLALNAATLVDNLAESQLFGHRRGAFSGAVIDKPGAFEVADNGTLLIDEIAELAQPLQAKLLRAVETGEIHRLGDPRPCRVDTRLVTATHRDLVERVKSGYFREDLYWRLCPTRIEVPPLRDRALDITPLIDHVLQGAGAPALSQLARLQPRVAWQVAELVERYLLYDWPGNARELREEALRLVALMEARKAARASGPLPPIEEACSQRIRCFEGRERTWSHQALPAIDPEMATRYGRLLDDAEALAEAIKAETSGNVKAFADKAANALGRSPASVRRTVYRLLGDRLAHLRRTG